MNYITTQIFTDNRINIIADRLFYYLDEKFTFDFVKEKIVLSGHCAAILQEAKLRNLDLHALTYLPLMMATQLRLKQKVTIQS